MQLQRCTDGPVTFDSLCADLRALGVESGMTMIVHSSLTALGWVSGGPQAVVLALQEVLGPQGTLVMPTHSGDFSDPAQWRASASAGELVGDDPSDDAGF